MKKLDNEQQIMVRDLIYRYCEIQQAINEERSSATNVCIKSYWIDILGAEKVLGLLSDDE